MYEPFFGFNRRPFSTAPDPGCFYEGESIREVLDELTTCVERGQGIALLTAPAGMGKSVLCQRLIVNLKGRFATIYLGNANFPTRRSLLQAILLELGDEYSRNDEAELRHTLQKRLQGLRSQHEALLLVVDEAHLFEAELLEEIRTLADIAEDGQPLVRIVLSGQLELEERLTDRHFDALNQRLGTHVYLEPLTQAGSADYLHHRIECAGGDAETVFTEDGFSIIQRASGGVPRCLNQLADHSLLLAFAADEQPVEEKTVRDALEDLKQLPLHWNDVGDTVSSGTFEAEEGIEDTADDGFADVADFADETDDVTFGFDNDDQSSQPDADAFDAATDALPESPADKPSFEVAWDATREPVAGEQSDVDVVPEEAAAEAETTSAAFTFDAASTTVDNEPASNAPADVQPADSQADTEDAWFANSQPAANDANTTVAEPAVLEFGAEPAAEEAVSNAEEFDHEFSHEKVATVEHIDETAEPTATEQQPAMQEIPGEAPVEAAAASAADVVEILVVDHYSTLEEPLSADIVWPRSSYFSPEAEPGASDVATVDLEDDARLADTVDGEPESPSASEAVSATEDPATDAEVEFVPQHELNDATGENADASEHVAADGEAACTEPVACETGTNDDVAAKVPAESTSVFEFSATETSATEDVAAEDEASSESILNEDSTADTEHIEERESLETMFEYDIDPQSETDIELREANEATFADAETLLSEFGKFDAAGDDEPTDSVDDSNPLIDAPAQEIDPARSLDTIDAILDELGYDANDVGRAVNDQSDRPERPSVEIESELLQTVDQSERDAEDEIGATMLDICLDTQSAVYEMTRQLRESPQSADVVEELSDEDGPHIADIDPSVFDVIEPEAEQQNVAQTPLPSEQASAPARSQPTGKRAFGSLFSDLRRRQQ